jgi:hypothetical protein
MKQVIVGMGEIGEALADVLAFENQDIWCKDEEPGYCTFVDWWLEDKQKYVELSGKSDIHILHICFPWSDGFIENVTQYQQELNPVYTIIHSTVPVGTSRKCNALHSPVIGRHPHLTEAIKTSTKFIGGKDAGQVADVFRRAGIEVYLTDKQESTELMKIDSTTWYGVAIEKTKDTKRQCDKYGVPFELFTIWTDEYNKAAERLGYPQVRRPNLAPILQKTGGHCVVQNCSLLDTPFTRLVKDMNETAS